MEKSSGQSLIEVLIVLTVAAVVLGAVMIAIITGLKNAQFAQNQVKATKYAQEALDKIKAIRDRDGEVEFNYTNGQTTKFSHLWGVNMSINCPSAGLCYFDLNDTSLVLTYKDSIGYSQNLESGLSRQIIFTDQADTYTTEKTVTAKVKWVDSSGEHESFLQRVLTPR
jgi:Tfp pilus assembly protein PilV